MKKLIIFYTLMTLMVWGAAGAYDTPDTYNIPQSFDLGENYYNVDGSPYLVATIIGSNELERGQTVTLNLDVVNNGKLLGFESDRTPEGADEVFAAKTEMELESGVVDAVGVVASLSADPDSPVEIQSVSQQLGTIKSGQNSPEPAQFVIKIDEKATAGQYNLYLDLSYDYLKNVQVESANATTQTYDVNRWYGMMAQNQTLKIIVKKQAYFEIMNTTGSLYPGANNIIEITIKNTGEEEALNVKLIANPSDPLSTTDDMAYLSTMEPNSTAVARIRIQADSEAVAKVYGVDTTLRYDTPEGNIMYSKTLEAPVEVVEVGFFQRYFGWLNPGFFSR
ncbi:MAG: hypothetical protein SCH66_10290 [Methanolobus sp.]|nr:hypothetical protein [Methanolobus sp.]